MTSKSEPGGTPETTKNRSCLKNWKTWFGLIIYYVLAMSACPKIINFGTQIPLKINEKIVPEKCHQKTAEKSIWDTYGPKIDPKSGPTRGARRGQRTTISKSGDPLGSFGEPYGRKTSPKSSQDTILDNCLIKCWYIFSFFLDNVRTEEGNKKT